MNEIDLAYTAGIIDGEGWISVEKRNPGKTNGNQRNIRYDITLAVANTDKKLIDYLFLIFGGYIYESHREKERQKKAYKWKVIANNARIILEKLLPYLKLKKERAILAIELRKLKDLPKNERYDWIKHENKKFYSPGLGGYKVKSEILKKEIEIRNKMLFLNKKGPV